MDIKEVALHLWPCWMLGLTIIYLTWKSKYRRILRIELEPLIKFTRLLVMIAVCRYLLFKFVMPTDMTESARYIANFIPWQGTLGVFWEDAAHSMPFALARKIFKNSKWYSWLSKPLLAAVMLSFASGHVYQGWIPAIMISLYIPFSLHMGRKYGFGTVMLCHILYDLSTLLTIKWFLG